MRILLSIIVVLSLTACGFHLQGSVPIPAGMARTRIEVSDDAFRFGQDLGRALQVRDVELVTVAADDVAVLRVHRLRHDERVLSVSELGTPLETELSVEVQFSLTLPGDDPGERQRLNLTRDHSWDSTDVLARETEAHRLRRALEEELVRRILSRIAGPR